ncbi:hypothetical protein KL933_003756 [Ogataea haglerorum]|uniref:CCR4-Not complex 3'-5'-exoribonuclease subunit Ccr4 n=1 Tax=Ogataea haglerorum TaxID=1937702 RepID=A0AAN6HZN2_9ASCO|nr:uncharacterized protein KL911_003881 [Ogataea haglerorum]KAG7694423.1 hypothetical protein KL915_003390 [Ogataea haglerorum]KAG7705241.1 hypothetical protein KL914_003927 [Ogataea haglerorum]KAG7705498.1 hypothetical protein KL950_003934 [Ogataea haglerorum]KAG7716632.1 hypothetical protein KL913_003148 [Ogataea haglerorum]KAG7717615.1 hypothetical protein KL949_003449 [Ogataea haglerorum]
MNTASQFQQKLQAQQQPQQQFQSPYMYQQQQQPFASLQDGFIQRQHQSQSQSEGLNPSSFLTQTLYQGGYRPSNQSGQQTQLQSLHQQLQQLQQPETPQQQQQQLFVLQGHQHQFQQTQPQLSSGQMVSQTQLNPIHVDASVSSQIHWQHQMQLAVVAKNSNLPHFYARQAASSSRRLTSNPEMSSKQGTSLVDITKSLLASVQESQQSQDQQQANEGLMQHKKMSNDTSIDEEEEDQRIRIKENNTQLWTALDLSCQMITTISPKLFHYGFLRRLYLNGNNLRKVPEAILQLKSLRVLDLSFNMLRELPGELGMLFNLKYLYLFGNDLKEVPYQFGNLYQLEFLGVEGNKDFNQEFVNIIAKKGTRGLIIHLRDEAPRLPPPEPRKWIEIGDDGEPNLNPDEQKPAIECDLSSPGSNSFTLMSYNTLCQHYATPKFFMYTPSWALAWEYRRQKLTEEILSYKTNIICLQEVETKTYEEYWVPLMESHGYKSVFHCKSRARTMNDKNAKKVDGCATFFQTSMFELIDKKIIEYGRVVMTQDKYKKTEDIFNRFMNKDNIASISILHHIPTGNKIVLANTHLHWDPEFNDVKTMQVAVLLEELRVLLLKYTNSKDELNKIPLLICGDFNSQTDSAVYQLFSQGSVKEHYDIKGRDYGKFTSEGCTHPFHLKSAYGAINELPFTNFSPTYTNVIEYIWYSTGTLSVRGLLGEMDPNYAKRVIGLPSADFVSDHLPLISKFEFKKSSSAKKVKVDFRDGSSSRKT